MVTHEVKQEQIRQLATYLRHHPGALTADPEAVARDSGVSIDLVRQSLQRSHLRPVHLDEGPAGPNALERSFHSIGRWLDFLSSKIFWSIGISTFIACLACGVIAPGRGSGFDIRDMSAILIVITVVILHMILYFRKGFARYAMWGSLISFGVSIVFFLITQSFSSRSLEKKLISMSAGGLGLFCFGVVYAAAGSACALMGAYRVVRDEDRTLRARGRQQLIERMFEIEELLGQATQVEPEDSWIRRFLQFGQRNVWWATIGCSAGLSILQEVASKVSKLPGSSAVSGTAALVVLVLLPLSLLCQIVLAFMGGGPVRSIFVSLIYFGVGVAIGWLPFFRSREEFDLVQLGWYAFLWGVGVLVGLFAGIGAQVEDRAYRRRRLNQNDPQLLLNELIEIQRTLNPDASVKFVMVVDAARSSVMKANADPMQAEWSFREYQAFLARIVESNGGRIHSTAGDGAIGVFGAAVSAFQAAREIQTRISFFNQNVNRLKDPFRLRIGIHCDHVPGDLTDVQFAAVIDIAAHVEGASQVGGIAVTQPVADLLIDQRFASLSELVDGYAISMALNPTLDPEGDA